MPCLSHLITILHHSDLKSAGDKIHLYCRNSAKLNLGDPRVHACIHHVSAESYILHWCINSFCNICSNSVTVNFTLYFPTLRDIKNDFQIVIRVQWALLYIWFCLNKSYMWSLLLLSGIARVWWMLVGQELSNKPPTSVWSNWSETINRWGPGATSRRETRGQSPWKLWGFRRFVTLMMANFEQL